MKRRANSRASMSVTPPGDAGAKLARSAVRKKFGTVDALLLFRRGIGIDHGAGLVLRRPPDRLHAAVAELIEIAGRDILELREQRARLRPGAVAGISDVADDGGEGVLVYVIGEL